MSAEAPADLRARARNGVARGTNWLAREWSRHRFAVLWPIVFVAGLAASWALQATGILNAQVTSLLLLVYAIASWRAASVAVEQFADSLYFLGFLLTLSSLVFAGLDGRDITFDVFSYAVITTGVGMFLRVLALHFIQSTESDLDDRRAQLAQSLSQTIEQANHALAAATDLATKVSAEVRPVIVLLSQDVAHAQQATQRLNADIPDRLGTRVDELARALEGLRLDLEKAAARARNEIEQVAAAEVAHAEAKLRGAGASIAAAASESVSGFTDKVADAAGRIDSAASLGTRRISEGAIEGANQIASAVASGAERIRAASSEGASEIASAAERDRALITRALQGATSVAPALESLRGSIEEFRAGLDRLSLDASTASSERVERAARQLEEGVRRVAQAESSARLLTNAVQEIVAFLRDDLGPR